MREKTPLPDLEKPVKSDDQAATRPAWGCNMGDWTHKERIGIQGWGVQTFQTPTASRKRGRNQIRRDAGAERVRCPELFPLTCVTYRGPKVIP